MPRATFFGGQDKTTMSTEPGIVIAIPLQLSVTEAVTTDIENPIRWKALAIEIISPD